MTERNIAKKAVAEVKRGNEFYPRHILWPRQRYRGNGNNRRRFVAAKPIRRYSWHRTLGGTATANAPGIEEQIKVSVVNITANVSTGIAIIRIVWGRL
jgi:hypothetical protein